MSSGQRIDTQPGNDYLVFVGIVCQTMESQMSDMPEGSLLYLDDWRGINIPRDFVDSTYRECISGVEQDDLDACLDPNGEWYWEAWDNVCRDAVITGTDGKQYTLYQDGALWLIPVGAEWPED